PELPGKSSQIRCIALLGPADAHGGPPVRRGHLPLAFLRKRACTALLRNSRSASVAIHRAARDFILWICSAARIVARFSRRLRLRMFRCDQFTAFLIKFRSSRASRRVAGVSRRLLETGVDWSR